MHRPAALTASDGWIPLAKGSLAALSGVRPGDGDARSWAVDSEAARDRPRLLVKPVHAMIVILVLTVALCASLTLFIQQARNLEQTGSFAASHANSPPATGSSKSFHPPTSATKPQPSPQRGTQAPDATVQSQAGPLPPGVVDLNTADVNQLDSVNGIGPVMAKRIIDYRTSIGRFSSVDQLLQVSGIGPKTLEKIRDRLVVR
ncbi:competence protein ComEA [Bifidobacterium actinocoloniiforme DSM 22766]|uniref:Competence protein ComEA n=1 Tax=Bifidobacterium actinocoloniiforme DSM 22766 TaxID=1437605 RepID=A0A086Z0A7_9BIFI|nr:helix-hairpin-helix domain-containing protein [Bifidobacterium actinocoloniiforme]AKV55209.1 hypothetical protein AB656_01910 [Bifidobacterium actinocoloniiforme DSM 22766]KFI39957.1 competence protein ComEA [Bifidobacterium actinocoloniiforme DSM 22766]